MPSFASLPRRSWSLRTRVVVPLVAVGTLVAGVGGWGTYQFAADLITERAAVRADLVLQALGLIAQSTGDVDHLQRFTTDIVPSASLTFVGVAAGSPATLLASSNRAWVGQPIEATSDPQIVAALRTVQRPGDPATPLQPHGGVLVAAREIPFAGLDRPAYAVVRMDLGPLLADAQAAGLRLALLVLSSVAVTAAAALLLLRRHVLVPLRHLQSAMQAQAAGQSLATVPVGRQDEIGQVAGTFNDMVAALATSQAENRRLAAVVNHTSNAVVIHGTDGRVEWVNEAFTRLFGYTLEDVRGQVATDLLVGPKTDRAILADSTARRARGEAFSYENIYYTREGRAVWLLVSAQPVDDLDGAGLRYVSIGVDVTERRAAAEALRLSEERFRVALANTPVVVFTQDRDLRYTWVHNPAAGYTPEQVVGRTDADLLGPENERRLTEIKRRVLASGHGVRTEVRLHHDGQDHDYDLLVDPLFDSHDEIVGVTCAAIEVTAHKAAAEALRQSEARFRRLFEDSPLGLFTFDLDGRITDANDALSRLLGRSVTHLRASPLSTLCHEQDQVELTSSLAALLKGLRPRHRVEVRLVTQGGQVVWTSLTASLVRNTSGEALYGLAIAEDVTDRRRLDEQLRAIALQDVLTGLANRTLLNTQLKRAHARFRRRGEPLFAVLFLDLDRFKWVNDSLGHALGDRLLVQVARRLEQCIRPGDTVARIGGDEFAILLDPIAHVDTAADVARRIHAVMEPPFGLDLNEVHISTSIGIAVSDATYERPGDLLRDADIAMYRAKARGKACFELFAPSMRAEAAVLLQTEADLRRALERSEFRLHYQPVVNLATGALSGFEVLLRWNHPVRGLLLPTDFLRVATETGLIVPIGWWVLEAACRQMQAWVAERAAPEGLVLSVNLSDPQLHHPELADRLADLIAATGLDPARLNLEVSEQALLNATGAATSTVHRLSAMDVCLQLDDFGMGYLPLSRLHYYPIRALKIDRSYVSQLGPGESIATSIVETTIRLAEHLKMQAVAKGVETAEQLRLLSRLGCTHGQGLLLSAPLSAEAATQRLHDGTGWAIAKLAAAPGLGGSGPG